MYETITLDDMRKGIYDGNLDTRLEIVSSVFINIVYESELNNILEYLQSQSFVRKYTDFVSKNYDEFFKHFINDEDEEALKYLNDILLYVKSTNTINGDTIQPEFRIPEVYEYFTLNGSNRKLITILMNKNRDIQYRFLEFLSLI